ncbi:MAG: type II toxin-antitoxin system prevent-host-death family antitoxin [Spirochaetes bacterium]|nr:type II toxin-antitoxin system prevent-host-death family antitoxin [Spirochaetota bacterium]
MQTINVSSLKAHLSKTLKQARDGDKILVVDRKMPIAQITPVDESITFVQTPKGNIPARPRNRYIVGDDVVALLLEERRR